MIGLLPAAGKAKRFDGLLKFLLPVPEGNLIATHVARMHDAGVRIALIGASYKNEGVIHQHAPAGTETYTVNSQTMCETVLVAEKLTRKETVLLGMPDTYWTDPDVYQRLAQMVGSGVSVAVAVWRVRDEQRGQVGQCALNPIGRIIQVVDKDAACPHEWLWGALAWSPAFWRYIDPADAHMGRALQRAIDAGETVQATCANGPYYDCGTIDNYFHCIRELTEPEVAR